MAATTRSLDDVVDQLGVGFGQYALALCCGEILSGLVKTLMSVGIHNHVTALGFTGLQRGLIFSAIFVGNSLGNATSGAVGDNFGRRIPILGGNVAVALGLASLHCYGLVFTVFFMVNVCLGLGIGIMGPTCWTLIGEVSPAHGRTFLSGVGHIAWGLGALATVGFLHLGHDMILSCTVVAFMMAAFSTWAIIESPAYLARLGDHKGAVASLESLRYRNGADVECTAWTSVEPPTQRVSYAALFERRHLFSTATCVLVTCVVNYSSYGMMYLLPILLPGHEVVVTVIGVLASLLANVFAMFFGHRIDRRLLMSWSLVFSAASGALVVRLLDGNTATLVSLVCVNFAAIGICFFGVYLYVVEVAGTACRASSAGLAMSCGRIAAAVAPLVKERVIHSDAGFVSSTVLLQIFALVFVLQLSVEPNLRQLGQIAGESAALSREEAPEVVARKQP